MHAVDERGAFCPFIFFFTFSFLFVLFLINAETVEKMFASPNPPGDGPSRPSLPNSCRSSPSGNHSRSHQEATTDLVSREKRKARADDDVEGAEGGDDGAAADVFSTYEASGLHRFCERKGVPVRAPIHPADIAESSSLR